MNTGEVTLHVRMPKYKKNTNCKILPTEYWKKKKKLNKFMDKSLFQTCR